jgi:hypothetical protein
VDNGRLPTIDHLDGYPVTHRREIFSRSRFVSELARDRSADLAAIRDEYIAAAMFGKHPCWRPTVLRKWLEKRLFALTPAP